MYTYHHMGIPTTESREGEEYIPKFKMYVSGYEGSEFRVQWHAMKRIPRKKSNYGTLLSS